MPILHNFKRTGREMAQIEALQSGDSLLSRGDVAKLLGVAPITVRYWEIEGKLSPVGKTTGGWNLHSWKALAAILRGAISSGLAPQLSNFCRADRMRLKQVQTAKRAVGKAPTRKHKLK